MDKSTQGIVLRIIKYTDTSNIIDLYTLEKGRCAVLVRIPKGARARVKNVLFQPLAILDIDLTSRTQSGLSYIKDVSASHVFHSLPYHPIKSSIAFFISEFVYHAVKEEFKNSSLFTYLKNSILWLDLCEVSYSNFHLVFLMRISFFLGLSPNLTNYVPGCYFDLLEAQFVTIKPTIHKDYLEPDETSRVHNLMRMKYDTMHLFKMSRHERSRILFVLNRFYTLHIPNFPELRSLDILQELFD